MLNTAYIKNSHHRLNPCCRRTFDRVLERIDGHERHWQQNEDGPRVLLHSGHGEDAQLVDSNSGLIDKGVGRQRTLLPPHTARASSEAATSCKFIESI